MPTRPTTLPWTLPAGVPRRPASPPISVRLSARPGRAATIGLIAVLYLGFVAVIALLLSTSQSVTNVDPSGFDGSISSSVQQVSSTAGS